MPSKEHSMNSTEAESSEKAMAWTINGSPERVAEAVAMAVSHLETAGWSGERLDDIKKILSVGIENTVTYANHGDAAKSIEVAFSVHDVADGKKWVEISLIGQDKAFSQNESNAPAPTSEEADLQGDRAGDLFIKLPPGVDVTLFPAENKIVLKQSPDAVEE